MQLPSLIIPLRYSPALRAALLATHLFPLVFVWLAHLAMPISVGVSLLLAGSAFWQLYVIRRRRGWRLLLHAAGHAQLQYSLAQTPAEIHLLSETRDLGWLIVLCWQSEAGGRVERFALCSDGLPAEVWRKLRISLRWRRLETKV